MIDITLQPVANQSLSVQLDGARYQITLKEAAGIMCATIVRDEVTLVEGARIVAQTPILAHRYQEVGNFVFLTEDDDYPYYPAFGVTQTLVYLSAAELAELRAA